MFCKQCGKPIDDGQELCEECKVNSGAQTSSANNTQSTYNAGPQVSSSAKSKLAAGLLGIFLGGWGIHNFYLGFTSKAVAQILVTIVTCGVGAIWGFIEGILILSGSIDKDANGVPLKD